MSVPLLQADSVTLQELFGNARHTGCRPFSGTMPGAKHSGFLKKREVRKGYGNSCHGGPSLLR